MFRFASRLTGRRMASSSTPSSTSSKFPPLEQMMTKEAYEARHHAEGTIKFWKYFQIFNMAALLGVALYSLPQELAHVKHLKEHQKEFVAYPYLRKRKNQYPWGDGDHTLFANSISNPDP